MSATPTSARSEPDRPARWPSATAVDGALAVSRLAAAGASQADPSVVHESLVTEARTLLDASCAAVLTVSEQGRRAYGVAGDVRDDLAVADHPALGELLAQRGRSLVLDAGRTAELSHRLLGDAGAGTRSALLVTIHTVGPTHVLVLLHPAEDAFPPGAVALAEALAAAAAAALARHRDAVDKARHLAGHRALTRSAKTLNESLDLATVLRRISQEANQILDGDYTAVYRGDRDGAVIEAATGLPELLGFRLAPGRGLTGRVLMTERSMLTNHYAGLDKEPASAYFADLLSCLAVPMHWGGELRGVLTVGYKRPFEVTQEHVELLEAFAGLAAVACANATAHAGLALAARTDGLTGCLNHAALHESLRREIERTERGPEPMLSLIMIDLDDFKAVNEEHGHLVGDELLRRAGHALRQATRPYDVAARYGGDEFALVAVEAGEEEAEVIAQRAIERIAAAIGDLSVGNAGRATAGVAQWRPGISGVELIADADRALLYGKHEEGRGHTVLLSSLPDWFRPNRFSRRADRDAPPPPAPRPPVSSAPALSHAPGWLEGSRPAEQRLRERTRALSRIAELGAELTTLVDDRTRMLGTAAAGLAEALQAASATITRLDANGVLEPVAGDRCADDNGLARRSLGEHRAILVTDAVARARLAVPVRVAGVDWGAIEVTAAKPGALDEDDLHLAASFAGQVGAAIGAGERHAAALTEATDASARAAT